AKRPKLRGARKSKNRADSKAAGRARSGGCGRSEQFTGISGGDLDEAACEVIQKALKHRAEVRKGAGASYLTWPSQRGHGQCVRVRRQLYALRRGVGPRLLPGALAEQPDHAQTSTRQAVVCSRYSHAQSLRWSTRAKGAGILDNRPASTGLP